MRTSKKMFASLAVVGAMALSACGADEAENTATEETTTTAPAEEPTPEESGEMDPAANLVGPGCQDYAEAVPEGEGSVAGMAEDPVAVAASNNPLLTTLVAAVSGELNPKVNLVDTLNGDEFTVFAPVDDAFAALPEETVTALSKPKNADMLTSILTYHVVPGQITPDELAGTSQPTAQGAEVEVTGEGDSLKVNDANVICGGVQTANATVYLIDAVLTPPAA